MEKMEEITARNKEIDVYHSRRNRLFGKAIYFASSVKITLEAHEKYRQDERGDVTLSKDSVEKFKAMAAEIEAEEEELQSEFRRLFVDQYKKDGENG